jgi:hypothetical protein
MEKEIAVNERLLFKERGSVGDGKGIRGVLYRMDIVLQWFGLLLLIRCVEEREIGPFMGLLLVIS